MPFASEASEWWQLECSMRYLPLTKKPTNGNRYIVLVAVCTSATGWMAKAKSATGWIFGLGLGVGGAYSAYAVALPNFFQWLGFFKLILVFLSRQSPAKPAIAVFGVCPAITYAPLKNLPNFMRCMCFRAFCVLAGHCALAPTSAVRELFSRLGFHGANGAYKVAPT